MLDMSRALTNPRTLDSFSVIRRKETVNSSGESTTEDKTFNGLFGVIFPEGQQNLDRRPESQLAAKGIAVITKFALRGSSREAGKNYQPDLVLWHGNKFVVIDVEDYTAYGPGFIKASCNMEDITGNSPVTTDVNVA